jgi:hypothetical protein
VGQLAQVLLLVGEREIDHGSSLNLLFGPGAERADASTEGGRAAPR